MAFPTGIRITTGLHGTFFVLALAILALVAASGAHAADFQCRAEVNRSAVPQGGNIILTVTGEGDVGWSADFVLPDLPGITIQTGGVNQSMNVVNGRTRTSVARTWYLTVHEKKDFTIGPVTVSASGETCRTEPIGITVNDPKPAAAAPPAHTGNRTADPGTGTTTGQAGDDIFVTLEIDQEEAWVGQQLSLTFRYLRRTTPWNNPSYQPPRTEGFWREDLGAQKEYRKVINGRAYNVTEINYALFPTRSGPLVIEPAELTFPEDVFDRFFSTRRRARGPRVLRTEGIRVEVKDLPAPRPEGFNGLVATTCVLRASVDRDSVPRGEAVGLRIQLNSDGFLKGFEGISVPQPEGARLHDATESFQTIPGNGRLDGRVVVEKVVIPGHEGTLRIPGLSLPWFDVRAGRYRTATTPFAEVVVTPSDNPGIGFEESGFLRQELSRLGDDLAFIHPVPGSLSRRAHPFTGGLAWWLLLVLPFVLLAGFRFFLARVAASRRDPAGRRRRAALARARTVLATRDDQVSPWDAVARAITGFVADWTDVPVAAVGEAEVRDFARQRGAEEAGERLAALLAEADNARFGGGGRDEVNSEEVEGLLLELEGASARENSTPGGSKTALSLFLAAVVGAGILAGSTGAEAEGRPGADPLRLLAEGNQAYTAGDVEGALDLYLQARELGVNDPVLHFNLGNAQARTGRLGEAVASYLRAQRLSPRDDDIKGNLGWVRRNLKDLELTEDELPLFIAQAAAIVGAFTLDQWGTGLVLAVWIAAGLLGWAWWREDYGVQLRRLMLGVTALVAVLVVISAGRWYREMVIDQAVVTVEVDVRSGPAENFPVQFKVHDGLTVAIEERRGDWVRIGMGGDWEGWLPVATVESVRMPQGR